MKKIFFLSAIALLIITNVSCDKEKNNNSFGVHNLSYSDCKSNNNTKTQKVEQTSQKEYLELKANDKYLKINHINAEFNCCPGKILVTSKISNDTIFIDENETEHTCNCICNYDVTYEVGKLDYGKYHIVLTKLKAPFSYKEFDLNFNSNTSEVININNKYN